MWEPQDDTREIVLEVMDSHPGIGYSHDTMFFKLIFEGKQRNMIDVKWAMQQLQKEGLISFREGRFYR